MKQPKNLKDHLEIILRDLNNGDISLQQSIGFSKRAVDRWQSYPQEPLPWEELLEVARDMMKCDPSLLNNSLGSAYAIKHYCEIKEILSRFPERGGGG